MFHWSFATASSKALEQLLEGNERYMREELLHQYRGEERRQKTAEKQTPFAIILGCSDSRVPPEIVFDQGIGDLFVVRVAGNVVGPIELDSLEYAALYMGSSLILVLGHENCSAVQSVMQGKTKDIEAIADLIAPAVQMAKKEKEPSLENAIKNNVQFIVDQLKKSSVIARLMKKGKMDVAGGYYDFLSGKVTILP
ncbi:MAG: carbonic anhydrase [Chlamydiae bacterium]|nr:carbonic anhydrase [Chlamydiota bacterium]